MTTIVTRSGKGSPLTNNEVDSNFTNLNTDKLETSGGSLTGAVSVVASTAGALVRITQTGAGDALLVEDSANPDSSPFVVDASGNVGIGTAAPANKLSIAVASGAVNAVITNGTGTQAVGVTSGNAGLLGMTSNHDLDIYTNNTVRMTIQAAGNVGIGTSSPDALLTVNTIASFGAGAAALPSIAAKGDLNTGMWFPAADTIAASTGGSERLRIDSSGRVGIGTSSPSEKLSVHSAVGIRGSDFSSLSYFGSTVNTTGVYTGLDSGGGYVINVRDAGYQAFSTNNAERMRIDSSGNVGIGTSSPGSLLTVNGNLAFNSGYGSAAVAYGCRAWVNFNGTGTVAIRGSGNVSSITDNGTGDYTVNYTASMPDGNYSCYRSDSEVGAGEFVALNTGSTRFRVRNSAFVLADSSIVLFAVFR